MGVFRSPPDIDAYVLIGDFDLLERMQVTTFFMEGAQIKDASSKFGKYEGGHLIQFGLLGMLKAYLLTNLPPAQIQIYMRRFIAETPINEQPADNIYVSQCTTAQDVKSVQEITGRNQIILEGDFVLRFGNWIQVAVANEFESGSYVKAALYGVGDKYDYRLFKETLATWVDSSTIEYSLYHVGTNMFTDEDGKMLVYSEAITCPRHQGSYWYHPFAVAKFVTFQISARDIQELFDFNPANRVTQVTGYHTNLMHSRPPELRRSGAGHIRGLNAAALMLRGGMKKRGPYSELINQARLWKASADGCIMACEKYGSGKVVVIVMV